MQSGYSNKQVHRELVLLSASQVGELDDGAIPVDELELIRRPHDDDGEQDEDWTERAELEEANWEPVRRESAERVEEMFSRCNNL